MQQLIDDILKPDPDQGAWPGPQLIGGQQPEILLVTCSDSRVVPHLATRSGPGRIFVIRNAGNMLPDEGTGSSEEATIEYGVRVLRIPHLLVCGHTHCGAMKGLLDGVEGMPALRRWLRAGRDTQQALGNSSERRDPLRAAVERNVLVQLERARAYPVVQEALEAGALELHGWVFDIGTGAFSCWDADTGAFRPLGEAARRSA